MAAAYRPWVNPLCGHPAISFCASPIRTAVSNGKRDLYSRHHAKHFTSGVITSYILEVVSDQSSRRAARPVKRRQSAATGFACPCGDTELLPGYTSRQASAVVLPSERIRRSDDYCCFGAARVLPTDTLFFSLVSAAIADPLYSDAVDWQITESADHAWIYVSHRQAIRHAEGWKLHVSAGHANAVEVLQRVLPVLLQETASFKITPSIAALDRLNQGRAGHSQVGKFITVYPNDDVQAVRLALALDSATPGLPGPPIPSDHPLQPGSLVHYRYGTFFPRYMQTLVGETVSALQAPDGTYIPDRRGITFTPPDWAIDPFVAAGVAGELPPPRLLIGDRFVIVGTMAVAARGAVYMALDLEEPRNCVLKMARRNATMTSDGSDACDRLRHEATMLQRLAAHLQVPQVIALVEQEGDLYLALEDVAGQTLAASIRAMALQGHGVGLDDLITWGRTLAQTLQRVHDAGFIYCDVKGSNIILTPDQQVRLIDFEYVYEVGVDAASTYGGTRGYFSPQQRAGLLPTVADTVYAVGAVLYSLATGIEPAEAPDPLALLARPVALTNPSLGTQLDQIIARCLDPDPEVKVLFAAGSGRSPGRRERDAYDSIGAIWQ